MNLTYKIMALVEEHEKTGRDVIAERMQKLTNVDELVEIFKKLESMGAENINLVTPTHYAMQIAEALKIYKPQ